MSEKLNVSPNSESPYNWETNEHGVHMVKSRFIPYGREIFPTLQSVQVATHLLNRAYQEGRKSAQRDIRNVLGIRDEHSQLVLF